MASRLGRNVVGIARLRPVISARPFTPIRSTLTTYRYASNVPNEPSASNVPAESPASNVSTQSSAVIVPKEPPAKAAQLLLEKVPGSTLVSKTAIVSATASIGAYAISNEYYVVNEETIVMVATLAMFWAVMHYLGPMYSAWADKYIKNQRRILEEGKQNAYNSVEERYNNVKELGNVVDITKGLFEVSKETARLEAQAYELEQKTALVAEAKTVLDSWARYEGQQKTKQQKEMTDSIIAKIQKELENPKTLQQILQQSVADVERIVSSKAQ